MKRYVARGLGIFAVCVCLIALSACASSPRRGRSGGADEPPSSLTQPTDSRIEDVVHALNVVGGTDQSFTAAHRERDAERRETGNVVVARLAGSSDLDPDLADAYRAAAAEVPLVFTKSYLSIGQAERMNELVEARMKAAPDEDFRISSFGMQQGAEAPYLITYVGKAGVPEEVRAALTPYGLDTVDFLERDVVGAGSTSAGASRSYDKSPFYGGAGIRGHNRNCTSGFSAHSGVTGNYYALTAAHCVPDDTHKAFAATWDSNQIGSAMGSVSSVDFASDLALINLSLNRTSAPRAWVGAQLDQDRYLPVTSVDVTPPALDDKLCVSGATSGAVCEDFVISVGPVGWDLTQYDGQVHVAHGYEIGAADQTSAIAGGDSGGLAYNRNHDHTEITAQGMLSAFSGPNEYFCPQRTLERPNLGTYECTAAAFVVGMKQITTSFPNLDFTNF